MTSVLYGSGLNYQSGNPVRQEIVAVRREVETLRKQMEVLTEENLIYRKYIMKLVQSADGTSDQFSTDLMRLAVNESQQRKVPGDRTVQGAGFTR